MLNNSFQVNDGDPTSKLRDRENPVAMGSEEFRRVAHELVDDLADFLESMPDGKVTPSPSVAEIKSVLGDEGVPAKGMDSGDLLGKVTKDLVDHSLFNGHPRFWGYVTSSATPIGALADLLASTINQNVGAWQLSPLATEIELQTIRWIAEFVGYPSDCAGLMVSGGNMANFIGFLAGRAAKASADIRKHGLVGNERPLCFYCSEAAHTWVQKAADLFGFGTDAIRWISCDDNSRMRIAPLLSAIQEDRGNGLQPFLVIASAGTVGTGAVDPISAIADICKKENLWLHIDGAYGAMAAALPDADSDLKAISRADSVALDPHKWLYSPLEAGCTLVRDAQALEDAFSFHPNLLQVRPRRRSAPDEFLRSWNAELTRVPCAEGLARIQARGRERVQGVHS